MNVLPLSPQALDHALEILRQGGVIAHATETCYGLACDLTNPEAVRGLFAIKQRPLDQPVSALFPSVEEAKKYVQWNDEVEMLATKYLPGPLTIILPLKKNAPPVFSIPTNNQQPVTSNSLGVRVSSHPLAQHLVAAFGRPISTTSANVHGQPNPYSPEEILRQFTGQKNQPDLILDSGTLPPTPPSTVIDLSGQSPQRKRQGEIGLDGNSTPR